MGKTRRVYSENIKAKVAMEAIRGIKTMSELSAAYNVHPQLIAQWKKHLMDHAPELFVRGKKSTNGNEEESSSRLYEEIGRLKLENDWLKKKL
jgi:putative transposase